MKPEQEWPAERKERRATAALIPSANNARRHSPEQVKHLAALILQFGWTMPVLVDEEDRILAGHGRVMAAQHLGLPEVPVIVARGWSEAQKLAYLIADNRAAEMSRWDAGLLSAELTEEDRARAFAAYGIADAEIAAALGLTEADLLQRHGRALAEARATARAAVAKAAFERAMRGEGKDAIAAAREFLRITEAPAMPAQAAPAPATTEPVPAPGVTCNFAELADKLGVSRPTLRDWLARWPDFPVLERGSNGVAYRFDPVACIAFIAAKREEERQAEARRAALLGQIEMPFGPPRTADGQELDLDRMAQLYRLAKQADELAVARGALLRAAEVRPHLEEMLSRARSTALALPRQWGARHNLPAPVIAAIRRDMDEWLLALHAELVRYLTAHAVPDPGQANDPEDDEAPPAAA